MAEGMKIKSKAQMYRLYQSGAFGNKLRTWESYGDLEKSSYAGLVTLRYCGENPGMFTRYSVPILKVPEELEDIRRLGGEVSRVRFSECAPDECLIVQGELQQVDHLGYSFTYSTEKEKMNVAMTSPAVKSYTGPAALLIARTGMTPSSAADLDALLEQYPGHVVEFSTYAYNLGSLRGRNAIFWEVRDY